MNGHTDTIRNKIKCNNKKETKAIIGDKNIACSLFNYSNYHKAIPMKTASELAQNSGTSACTT